MKTPALLFAAALLSAVSAASAYDSDPGFGSDRPWLEGVRNNGQWFGSDGVRQSAQERMSEAKYYRPTQRYYGNGFTVSYRYIPVFPMDTPREGSVGTSTNFRTEGFRLTPGQIQAFGATQPRLTMKDASAAPRTAVTSIDRKKTTKRTSTKGASQDAPAIKPSPMPATDGAAPAVAPDAAAPAPSAPAAPPKP